MPEKKKHESEDSWKQLFEENIFADQKPSQYNGYRILDTAKIAQFISFFA